MKRRVPVITTEHDTFLHRRDPRVKWLTLLTLMSLVYLAPSWQWMAAVAVVGLGMAVVARVPAKWMAILLGLQIPQIVTFLAFPAVARWLTGQPPLQGGFGFSLKVVFSWPAALFIGASIFTTMELTELTDGLRGLGAPELLVFTFEYVFLLFFITLSDFYRMVDAMKTKSVNVDTKNPLTLAANLPKLGIPMIIGLLRRSNTMMAILKMRGYSFTERPELRTETKFDAGDATLLVAAVAVVAYTAAVRFDLLVGPAVLL
ncbi:MAG: energy-coupling factor transporter transmembrane protein EcfT [Halobaculum sp.]